MKLSCAIITVFIWCNFMCGISRSIDSTKGEPSIETQGNRILTCCGEDT
jgi:hypothetical protein